MQKTAFSFSFRPWSALRSKGFPFHFFSMIKIRNNARCVRKYSLSNGVLCVSCYCEDKCYLRLNVILKTGEFTDVYSCVSLQDFYDEISVVLSVCSKLLFEELAK